MSIKNSPDIMEDVTLHVLVYYLRFESLRKIKPLYIMMRSMRYFSLAILCTSVVLLLFFIWSNKVASINRSSPKVRSPSVVEVSFVSDLAHATENGNKTAEGGSSKDHVPGQEGPLLLLQWTHPWSVPTEGPSEGQKAGNCTITYDRSKLSQASAVMFHYSSLDKENMPWTHYRHPDQVFVFQTMESPSYIRNVEQRDMRQFDHDFINWTMSYRFSSDIFSSYFTQANEIFIDANKRVNDLLAKKSNVALWVVSNCDLLPGSRMRMKYVKDLIQAGLPVHRYGACFNNKEEFGKLPPETLGSYKFYLSFENAVHCQDYMTEKLWTNAIKSGRVPVIWGPSKADVTNLVPPGSFIHCDDFATPARLAEYLLYLDKNETAYREYFDWRVKPSQEAKRNIEKHRLIREEQLCNKLQKGFSRKTIKLVSDWMFSSESKECLQP